MKLDDDQAVMSKQITRGFQHLEFGAFYVHDQGRELSITVLQFFERPPGDSHRASSLALRRATNNVFRMKVERNVGGRAGRAVLNQKTALINFAIAVNP